MIKHIFMDVDGTLTDGKIYYTSSGEEAKAFNTKDGSAIMAARSVGINIIIATGRKSSIVNRRMKELGIEEIYQGVRNKKEFIINYSRKNIISLGQCGYIGDDLNDLACMKLVGFKGCPADACDEIKNIADYISKREAGKGAVRDILEYLLRSENLWEKVVKQYE